MVNHDGSLFKCTARDFSKVENEGRLMPDGMLAWNDRFHKRMSLKYGNSTCRNCNIFPICHGGCSQDKLESTRGGCIRGYSDIRKQEIIEGHIMSILKQHGEENPH